MALRDGRVFTLTPGGVCDAVDGTNAPPGASAMMANLIPDVTTAGMWQPRPAAVKLTSFAGFTTPGFISALLVVGNIAYGMIASGRNAGKDEPFAYNLATGAFLTVSGITAANCPTSPATAGDWTPPVMAAVGTRIVVCHPGFPGGATKFGWFDVSGFTSTSLTGTTANTSPVISALSSNPIAAGVQPGDTVAGANVQAGSTVISLTTTTVTLSLPCTGSTAGVALTFGAGTPAAPRWAAGDVNVNPLPSVPLGVVQFNGRAYYACGTDGVVFSDSLLACNRTNATQALNFGNGLAVTALGALPLSSPITGGIVQSVIAFQGVAVLQQITGDPATSNLAVNALDVSSGTLAPLSVSPTELGLAYISPEGLRTIDFSARVSTPLGGKGDGVAVPFINTLHASRIVAAGNADTIRITTINGARTGQPSEEYWYDITRSEWSGPHTSTCDQLQVWAGTFLCTLRGVTAALFQSDVIVNSSSSYIENGTQLTYNFQTVLSPDSGDGRMQAIKSATIFASFSSVTAPTVLVVDDTAAQLDLVVMTTGNQGTVWGAFAWGGNVWSGIPLGARQHRVPWHNRLVFKQAQISMTGQSGSDFRLGNMNIELKSLGYMTTLFSG